MDRVAFVQLELDRMNFILASVRNGGERDKMASREEPHSSDPSGLVI